MKYKPRHLKIREKILLLTGVIFVLFTVIWGGVLAETSLTNLHRIKEAELTRMSKILAAQAEVMEQQAGLTVRNFEINDPLFKEITLLANIGPYYADPSSYFEETFIGQPIEAADQIYALRSQLNLIELLRVSREVNNLDSISFYYVPPFDQVADAEPVLAFRLESDAIVLNRFISRGAIDTRRSYWIPLDEFVVPSANYFDISTAYSASPELFYAEMDFRYLPQGAENEIFGLDWEDATTPQSRIIIKDNVPVIQTWYTVKTLLPHPESWEDTLVPVGVALVEQKLNSATMSRFKNQLGINVGFAGGERLWISSLAQDNLNETPDLSAGIFNTSDQAYYYAQEPVTFASGQSTYLSAVAFSPTSELAVLINSMWVRISIASVIVFLVIGSIVYLGLHYLLNRPLKEVIKGVRLISAGDLTQKVPVQSGDELGELAQAFNQMSRQLQRSLSLQEEIIETLEDRVSARTRRLEIVATLSERLSAILRLEELLEEVVNQVRNTFDYYHAHIYLLNEETSRLMVTAGTGPAGQAMKEKEYNIPLDAVTSLVARAARTGEVVSVSNVRQTEGWLPNPLLPDTRAEMAVPVILDGQVVGVLDVQESKPAGFDEGDVSLLRSLANQVAVAIRNARLFAEVEDALAEAHSTQELYVEQSWQKVRTLGSGAEHYHYVHPQAPELTGEMLTTALRQALNSPHTSVVEIEEISNESGDSSDDLPPSVQRSIVSPIKVMNKTIGAMHLHPGKNKQTWTEDDLLIVEAVVEQLAQAAENMRLFNDTRRRASREQAIRQITEKMRAATSMQDLVNTAAQEFGHLLAAGHTVIDLGIQKEPAQASDTASNGSSKT